MACNTQRQRRHPVAAGLTAPRSPARTKPAARFEKPRRCRASPLSGEERASPILPDVWRRRPRSLSSPPGRRIRRANR